MAHTIDRIYQRLASMNDAARLVALNVAVFIVLFLIRTIAEFTGHGAVADATVSELTALPASLSGFLRCPWTLFSYMFTHYDFFHLLFNMLWLYMFAVVFLECASHRALYILYIVGGAIGGALFIAASAFTSEAAGGRLVGASGSVLAIVTATAILMPDYRINLLFIGAIKMKWLAFAMILLDLVGVTSFSSADMIVGNAAHLGGIAVGAIYAISVMIMSRRRINSRRDQASCIHHIDDEATLNELLDKVKRSGYASLSRQEMSALVRISNKHRTTF